MPMLCDIRFKVHTIGELIRDSDCPPLEDYNDFAEAWRTSAQTVRSYLRRLPEAEKAGDPAPCL